MKIFVVLIAVFFHLVAHADPNVISDSTKQTVTHCGYLLDTLAKAEVPIVKDADGDPYCKVDISNLTTGAHTIKLTFINKDSLWGRLESVPSLPFTVTKPAIPSPPLNLIVTP